MLTRSIDRDPFDTTIEQKVFRGGKRIGVGFAMVALAIGALDLIGAGSAHGTGALIHNGQFNYAELSDRVRTVFGGLPSLAGGAMLAHALDIDVERLRLAVLPSGASAVKPSRVADIGAATQRDAVRLAMASPVGEIAPGVASMRAVVAPLPKPVQLASLDTGMVTEATVDPSVASASALATSPMSAPMSSPLSPPIARSMVPLPIPAPGVPPPSPAQRLKLDDQAYAKAAHCLATAIYWESRGEMITGQEAVAQVVLNRVFSPYYPNDVCGVVYQNASRPHCQFTFACDGRRKVIRERAAWARANRIAHQTLDGRVYVEAVAKSTHYHAVYVHPDWVREMRKLVRFGIHNFYRPYRWGDGAAQPVWGSAALAQRKKH